MRYLSAIAALICGCAYTLPHKMEEAAPPPVLVPMPAIPESAAEPTPNDAETGSESALAPLPVAPPSAEPVKPTAKPTAKPTPEVSAPSCSPCYQPCHRFVRRR